MALTRPLFNNLNTTVEVFADPLTVLHGGATTANVDVGFIMNRANGLVSNVALYWNESGNAFVTAFTSNSGATDSNVSVTSYANIVTGGHTVYGAILPAANVTYDLGSPTQRFRTLYIAGNTIDMGGALISSAPTGVTITHNSGSTFTLAAAGTTPTTSNATGAFGNLIASSGLASTSTSTGALQITGGAGITGNLYVGGNLVVTGTQTFLNTETVNATEYVTTVIASTVNSATIGNIGANMVGTGTYLTSLNASNLSSGTIPSAQVSGSYTGITAVGTIGTGVWQGTLISPTYGGTGVNNGSNTLTLSGSYTLNQSVASGASPTFAGTNFSSIPNNALTNSSVTVTAGTGLSGGGTVALGSSVTLNNAGVTSTVAGTDITVSGATGAVTIGTNSTLATVTGRGATTSTAISLTNSTNATSPSTGALVVSGGLGVSQDLWVGGSVYANNIVSTTYTNLSVNDPLLYLAVSPPYPYTYDLGMYSHFIGGPANVYAHTGMVRSYSNGYWGLFSNVKTEPAGSINWADAGLVWDKLKTGDHIIANTTASSSTTTGALQVAGGAGIAGALYAGSAYDNGNRVLTSVTVTAGTGLSGGGTITGPTGSVTLTNAGVTSITGTANQVIASASTGGVTLSLPQSINSGAAPTFAGTNFSSIPNGALTNSSVTITAGTGLSGGGAVSLGSSVTLTNAGVTSAVAGTGVSVSGATGAVTITNTGVTSAVAGTDITVSGATGAVTIGTNSTLATVTGRGATTSTAVSITNSTTSTSTSTGALTVSGGVGVAGNIVVGAVYTTNGLFWAGNNNVISTGGGGGGVVGLTGQLQYNNGGTAGASSLYYFSANTSLGTTSNIIAGGILTNNYYYANGAPLSSTFGLSGTSGTGSVTGGGTLTFAGTNGVTATVSGSTVTIAEPQNLQTSATPTFAGGSFTGNVTRNSKPLVTNYTGSTAPSSPIQGDTWYNSSTDVIYQYVFDGTNTVWVDTAGLAINGNTNIAGSTLNISGTAATGALTVTGALSVSSSATITGTLSTGGLSVSTLTGFTATGSILPGSTATYNLGSSSYTWATIYGKATSATYADLAEIYSADIEYLPGTVVVFGGTAEVTTTMESHDPRVAGVISTDPAHLMNAEADGVAVALTGRVPCFVKGPVRKGDRLVTSDIPGVAEVLNKDRFEVGCVIGKSLCDYENNDITTIEIAVGRY